jgi:hypothetical protein
MSTTETKSPILAERERRISLIENLRNVIDTMQEDQDSGEDEGIYDEPEEPREDIQGLRDLLAILEEGTSVMVVIEGGVCQGAWSNEPNMGFDVLDFDNLAAEVEDDQTEMPEHDAHIISEAGDRIYPIF